MISVPQVLTIAGSDCGGGAGLQADLKTFQERGVYGMSIILATTAQNTLGVQDVHPIPIAHVQKQFDSIFSDFKVSAMKTGMLFGRDHIECVAKNIAQHPHIPYVLDPVMIAKGGASLMDSDAIHTLIHTLLPLATLITPNLPEAEVIVGHPIQSHTEMIQAAQEIQNLGATHVVLKGGHLNNSQSSLASDLLLLDDGTTHWFESPRVTTERTHGTGDTFAACIVSELAKGRPIVEAVRTAKDFVRAAIAHSIAVGHGHGPTNHWAYRHLDSNQKYPFSIASQEE